MGLTISYKNQLVNLFGGRTQNMNLGNVYLGLATGSPTDTDSGLTGLTEISAGGYARVLLGSYNSSATYKMAAASNGSASNDSSILFPKATANWGSAGTPITYLLFFSAATGGTPFAYAPLSFSDSTHYVPSGNIANFDANALTITISDPA